jgi:hypothetical protein
MPTKASAKVGAKAKREAIAKAFGDVPVDSENMDFLYSRRHRATVRDGKWRELKYIVELDELVERFLGSNHIRRPLRVCRTKCG